MDPKTLPLSDLSFFQQLAEKSGEEITRELIACAPDAVKKEITDITNAVAQNRQQDIKSASHALKGASYSMQAARLAYFAREMELAAFNADRAVEILPKLQQAAEDTIAWWIDVLENEKFISAAK
jgi:HPt (histidine-containing phosphotransfer) domain-containing protein